MLNSTIAGGYEAREALAQASLRGEVSADWCIGTCKPWSESEAGRARYAELREINEKRKVEGLEHI